MIVRLSEGRWMDLDTLHRFERFEAGEECEAVVLHVVPMQGPRMVLCGGEALAVEGFLTDRTRPWPLLTVAPGLLDREALPDAPQLPTVAEVMDEALAALRGMVQARREDARLNVLQRLRRFIFGGAR